MKKGYIIECTYTDENGKENIYYLMKGGYVTHLYMQFFSDEVYKTEGIAKRRCKELSEINKLDVAAQAKRNYHIYYEEQYQPKEVLIG